MILLLDRTGVSEEHNQVSVVGSVGCRVVAVHACHYSDLRGVGVGDSREFDHVSGIGGIPGYRVNIV